MAWLNWFKKKDESATVAKDRLQIIVARERTATASGGMPGYLPQLQQELLQVIARYEKVDLDMVTVNIDKKDEREVLELNIPLNAEHVERPTVRTRMVYA